VDLIVVLIVAAVVILLAWRLLNRSTSSTQSYQLTYQVQVDGVDRRISDSVLSFELPAQLVANSSLVSGGYVVAVEAKEPDESGELIWTAKSGTVTARPREDTVTLIFTIEAVITDPVNNTVSTQDIRVGADNTVKTSDMELDGVIIWLEKTEVAA